MTETIDETLIRKRQEEALRKDLHNQIILVCTCFGKRGKVGKGGKTVVSWQYKSGALLLEMKSCGPHLKATWDQTLVYEYQAGGHVTAYRPGAWETKLNPLYQDVLAAKAKEKTDKQAKIVAERAQRWGALPEE